MSKNLILSLGLLCVTGTARAAEEAAAKPAPAAASAPAAKTINWDKMSFAERKKYMKKTVLPEMKKLFVAFDSKKYASMTCQTCHGEKAVENKFKMPNPELPKLPGPTDRPAFMALAQKKPEAVKFMGTQVKPQIATLLGKEQWTPANPKGFACYGCHTTEAAMGGPTEPGGPKAPAETKAPAAPAEAPGPKGW